MEKTRLAILVTVNNEDDTDKMRVQIESDEVDVELLKIMSFSAIKSIAEAVVENIEVSEEVGKYFNALINMLVDMREGVE